MQIAKNPRMQRGYELAQSMEIKQVHSDLWIVPSQNGNGEYSVLAGYDGYSCTCPDYIYRHEKVGECKHIWAMKYYLALKDKVQTDIAACGKSTYPTDVLLCRYCNSSNVAKSGTRGKRVVKQRYLCNDCKRRFVADTTFERMKNDPKIISLTLSMYFRNMTLRSIAQTLEDTYGLKVAHTTIFSWIKKYERLLSQYVSTLKVEGFSGKVNMDEMYIRLKGEMKYLFNAIDPETKYLLASVLAQRKSYKGARAVMQATKKAVGHDKRVQTIKQITTDKLGSYERAWATEFCGDAMTKDKNPPKHIVANKANGVRINNPAERLHNTLRERERVYRGLKSDDTPIINMQTIHYNFVRKHRGLKMADGSFLTPAEMVGVDKDLGRDKWLGLIRKASSTRK